MSGRRFVAEFVCAWFWEFGVERNGGVHTDEFEGSLFEGFVDLNIVPPVSSDLTWVVSKECLIEDIIFLGGF